MKPTLIDRTLSVGLLHDAASELLIRRAMEMHQSQGMKLRHEADRAPPTSTTHTSDLHARMTGCRNLPRTKT